MTNVRVRPLPTPGLGTPSHPPRDPNIPPRSPDTYLTRIGIQGEATRAGPLWLPYAPREVSYEGFGRQWVVQQRDGDRKPLVQAGSRNLRKMSFTLTLATRDWYDDVHYQLTALETLAETTEPVIVYYSDWEIGFWHITNMRVTSRMRTPDTSKINQATVDLEFTEAVDLVRRRKPTNPPGNGGGGGKRPKFYRVKKGDTLWKIAKKFYGTHKAWRKIGRANKIKKAHKELKVGRKLRLP